MILSDPGTNCEKFMAFANTNGYNSLLKVSVHRLGDSRDLKAIHEISDTYTAPSINIANTESFCLRAICRRQTIGQGIARIRTSRMMVETA